MAGDREKFLKAGMNDYIPKPVDRAELLTVIGKHLPADAAVRLEDGTDGLETPRDIPQPDGLDTRQGVERLGGSWELYVDILHDFCRIQKGFASEFREMVENGDFEGARNKVHALKGAAGNVSANDLNTAAKALELEMLTADGKTERMHQLLSLVQDALERVIRSVEDFSANSKNEDDAPSILRIGKNEPGISFGEALDRLANHVGQWDPIASKSVLDEIRPYPEWRGFETQLEELGRMIGDYDFEGAGHFLADLRGKLGADGRLKK